MSQLKDIKTGKWFYYGAYVDEDGIKHQYKKRGFISQREARKAEDRFRDEVDAGVIGTKIKTFEKVSKEFMKFTKKRIKNSSYITHKETLNKINLELGNVEINKLTAKRLQEYIDKLDATFSKKYVERIYYLINQILNYAIDHNYIPTNTLKSVKRDARKNLLQNEMIFWEPDQFEKFIKIVDNFTYKTLFMFLYYMGCRKGEALALQWKDVNYTSNFITINKTVSFKETPYIISTPKTKNSIRNITMPKIIANQLTLFLEDQSSLYEFSDSRYIFGYNRPIPPENIRRAFKKYINLANRDKNGNLKKAQDLIPVIRLHDLRHSHASYLLNNMSDKFTDFDIAKRLGDTVQTLHNTYAHWFKSADKGIIDFMNEDLSKR